MYNVSFYYVAVCLNFCICFLYTGRYWKIDLNLNKTAYLNKIFALEYKVADKQQCVF